MTFDKRFSKMLYGDGIDNIINENSGHQQEHVDSKTWLQQILQFLARVAS